MLVENESYVYDTRVRREASALQSAGYRVSVICPGPLDAPCYSCIDGVHVYQFRRSTTGRGTLLYIWEYLYALVATAILSAYVLFRRGFDVVHTANPPDLNVLVAMPYRLLGKKFVYDHHDLAPELYCCRFRKPPSSLLARALLALERLSARCADHVISTNESCKLILSARAKVPAWKVTVVRNGPDDDHLGEIEAHPLLASETRTIIGFVGTVGFQDGVDSFVQALDSLRRDLGKTSWLAAVVGDGDALPDVKRLAASLDLSEHLLFAGRVLPCDVPPLIKAMDICVVPDPCTSYSEHSTFIKTMEYMAQGKPIVAFDLWETRRSAEDAAMYAGPGNQRQFAEMIAELIDKPSLRRQLGRIGRRRVLNHLAWFHQKPKLLAVYEDLAAVAQT